jgi:hypothetical protein
VQVACHILLKIFQKGLQLFFRPHLNLRSEKEVMGLQNDKNPNFENFETLDLGVLGKMTFGCNPHG